MTFRIILMLTQLATFLLLVLLATENYADFANDEYCHQFRRGQRTVLLLAETSPDEKLLLLDDNFTGFHVSMDRLKNLFTEVTPALAPYLDLQHATLFHLAAANRLQVNRSRGAFFYRSPQDSVHYPIDDPFVVVVAANRSHVTMLPLNSGQVRSHSTGSFPPETDVFFSIKEHTVYLLNGSRLYNIGIKKSTTGDDLEFGRSSHSEVLPIRSIRPTSHIDGGFVLAHSVAIGFSNRLSTITIYKATDHKEVTRIKFGQFFRCSQSSSTLLSTADLATITEESFLVLVYTGVALLLILLLVLFTCWTFRKRLPMSARTPWCRSRTSESHSRTPSSASRTPASWRWERRTPRTPPRSAQRCLPGNSPDSRRKPKSMTPKSLSQNERLLLSPPLRHLEADRNAVGKVATERQGSFLKH